MRVACLLLLLLPLPALAECPPAPDLADERATLHTRLLEAPDQRAAETVASQLWEIWTTAPDARAQALLDEGMERREAYAWAEAEAVLDDLVAYCPDYAEGYNQRAFVRFLREDFDGALADLDQAIARNPYHFGALAGRGLSLLRQGRMQLGQEALRRAVAVHPFLRERAYLVEPEDPT